MSEPSWLRIAADALLDEKLTDAAAASGEALGYYMQRPNFGEAAEQFKDALRKRENIREKDPVAATMGANAAASLLPQTRVIRAIQRAKQILNGDISTIDNSKRNVRIGKKKFPSENPDGLNDYDQDRIPMRDGHYGYSRGRSGEGEIYLHDDKDNHYQTIKYTTDRDGTVSIYHDFPTTFGEDNPDVRRGRSREMRHIMAEALGGIGSDPDGNNTDAGVFAYYKDPKAHRVYPEDLEDSDAAAAKYNRFFTPGYKEQGDLFEETFQKKYGKSSLEHKDDASGLMARSKQDYENDRLEAKRQRQQRESEYKEGLAALIRRQRQETEDAVASVVRNAPDVYNRKTRALSQLPAGSDDRRHVIADHRRELLGEFPDRDRAELGRQYSGDLIDENKTSWERLIEILKNR